MYEVDDVVEEALEAEAGACCCVFVPDEVEEGVVQQREPCLVGCRMFGFEHVADVEESTDVVEVVEELRPCNIALRLLLIPILVELWYFEEATELEFRHASDLAALGYPLRLT